MNNNSNTVVDREELRKQLVHGDLKKLESITNRKRSSIYRWFKYILDDKNIEEAVTGLIAMRKRQMEQSLSEMEKS